MNEGVFVEQKTSIGTSDNTLIGQQINYNGLSPEEASNIAINLFMDNFPKLQQQAMEKVEERIKEFNDAIMLKLADNVEDYSAFNEPDVQYALYEAQNNYARFGSDKMLSKLTSLVAKRVCHNDDEMCLKVAIDQAISIVGMLNQAQLDYLALMFLATKVKFKSINTIEDLRAHLNYLDSVFSKTKDSNWQHLNMLGCLQLDLPDVCEIYAKRYNLNKSEVEKICPQNIKALSGDYSTSPIGTIIGIIHAEQKTPYQLDPRIWIHD